MASISFDERTNADGSTTVVVRYRDNADKQRKKSFREPTAAKSRKAAKEFEARLRPQLAEGDFIDPTRGKRLFGDVAGQWLDGANPHKRESSVARDEIVIRKHLAPIADIPIAKIQPSDVRSLVADWSHTYAPRTVHRTYGVLRAICTWAVGEDIIRRSPCRGIRLPSKRSGGETGRILTSEELIRLAQKMEPEHQVMVWLMALLGLRWGEAAAIRVRSITFGDPAHLTISETVLRDARGRSTLGPPKSDAGHRRLTMPAVLSMMLTEQIERRGLIADDGDALVFVNSTGEVWNASNWRQRVWLPAAIAAGLGEMVEVEDRTTKKYVGITPHDLRRTNATTMVGADVDIKTAQTRLGHSDVRMTLEIYARALSERDQGAADSVADALFGGSD